MVLPIKSVFEITPLQYILSLASSSIIRKISKIDLSVPVYNAQLKMSGVGAESLRIANVKRC